MDQSYGFSSMLWQPRDHVGKEGVCHDAAIGGQATVADDDRHEETIQHSVRDAEDIPALHPATRGDIILDTTDTNHGLPGTPPVAKQLMPIVGVVKCEWKCCGGEMQGCDVQLTRQGKVRFQESAAQRQSKRPHDYGKFNQTCGPRARIPGFRRTSYNHGSRRSCIQRSNLGGHGSAGPQYLDRRRRHARLATSTALAAVAPAADSVAVMRTPLRMHENPRKTAKARAMFHSLLTPDYLQATEQLMPIVGVVKCERKPGGEEMLGEKYRFAPFFPPL
ncbi:hypothetical protein HPB48_002135 [Haemaphysalis longicornis]|uniref:Uncharacterized protein n=1 Tax=Haemaphysalis longicornis TaxID=44386 RepID=A0A9J6FGP1_HAELO|nr:hypothetical protein HPB48_002135 [Haemaphysalis longicornis]